MVFRWFLQLIILSLMAGCGSQSVISDPKEVPKLNGGKRVDIGFWHTYSEEETLLLEQELIPAFEREYPKIRVQPLQLANNNEFKYTLISRNFSTGSPDVVRMDNAWVPGFSRLGLLRQLNKFPDFQETRSKFHPKDLDAGFYENHYYSLPLNTFTKVAIFNKELLNQAGYSVPPSSMEEVLKIAHKHGFTIGLGGYEAWNTLPYIYSLGGRLTNQDFTRADGYLNGAATVRAVEQLLLLYKEKIIDFSVVTGGGDNWDGVKEGNILLTDEGPWFYSTLNAEELNKALKLTIPVPFPGNNGPASMVSGEHLVIPNGSKHPDEAWTFLKWMSGKEPQLIMSQTGLVPSNVDAAEALKVSRESFVYPYLEAMDAAFLRVPPVKNWDEVDEVYTRYLKKIFLGEIIVKNGLDRAAAEIDRLL